MFSPVVRQALVASAPLLAALSVGGATTYPTVLLHQLKANDSSIQIDFETSTWIGSIHGLAGIPSILVPTLMQWRGRKIAFIVACIVVILGWIVAFTATNTASILVSESLHGLGCNSIFAISFLSISEMMSPTTREMFMQMYLMFQVFTMALNGLLTQYLHWKTIGIIMCTPMVISALVAFKWPESPYWLAYKGKLIKCERAFVWLRGTGDAAKKELEEIILQQRENESFDRLKPKVSIRHFWNTILSRDFYVPAFHMFILQYLVYWSGSTVVIIYSIELLQKTTQNKDVTFYSGFIINCIVLFGIGCGLVVNKYFNKKTVLLFGTLGIVLSLFGASLFLFWQSVGVVSKQSLLSMSFILAYVVCASTGVMPLAYPVSTSLMPVKYRGIGGALFVINTCLLHSTSLKFSPYLFVYLNLWGTFLLYALNSMICGLILWKYIPEIQGKTLKEIENYYAGQKNLQLAHVYELQSIVRK